MNSILLNFRYQDYMSYQILTPIGDMLSDLCEKIPLEQRTDRVSIYDLYMNNRY